MSETLLNSKGTKNWWATQWIQALTQWYDPERLARGTSLARQGRVVEMTVQVGLARARVQGADGIEQEVRIDVRTFSEEQWQRIIAMLAGQAIYTAQLLNGEMPYEIDGVFRAAGVSLFPRSATELVTECSCADWVRPCVHIVAALDRLGELLDADPFTMLVLRGRSRDQLMAELRAERAERLGNGDALTRQREPQDEPSPLDADLDAFWRMGDALQTLRVHIERPDIELELVRILGAPEFSSDSHLLGQLERVYKRVTEKALHVAYAGEPQDDPLDNGHGNGFLPIVSAENGQEEELA